MRRLSFEPTIATPCHESWQTMTGTPSQRHCASCNKTVHNLATLTPRQIEHLVHTSNGNLCARITRREDGSLVTAMQAHTLPAYALSAALAFIPSTALAQTSNATSTEQSPAPGEVVKTTTAVNGTVTDSQGALVVGAQVKLILNGQSIGATMTNQDGQFEFAVIPGDYKLQVSARGFTAFAQDFSVTSDHAAVASLSLTPGTSVSVQVTVNSLTDYTTMGEMSATYSHWYTRLGYRLRHPVAYTKFIMHRHS